MFQFTIDFDQLYGDSKDNMVRWYKRSIFIKNDQNGSKSKSNKKNLEYI